MAAQGTLFWQTAICVLANIAVLRTPMLDKSDVKRGSRFRELRAHLTIYHWRLVIFWVILFHGFQDFEGITNRYIRLNLGPWGYNSSFQQDEGKHATKCMFLVSSVLGQLTSFEVLSHHFRPICTFVVSKKKRFGVNIYEERCICEERWIDMRIFWRLKTSMEVMVNMF